MKAKPRSLGNTTSNAKLKTIYLVLGNIIWRYNIQDCYVDEDYPWMFILSTKEFEMIYLSK